MSKHISLVIPGKPVAKARPRVFRHGKFTRAVTPTNTVNYETQIRERFATEYPGFEPMDGGLSLMLDADFPIPTSASKRKRELMLDGEIYRVQKPDLDNVIKIVMDALTGLAYKDDSQIVEIAATKGWSETPRVSIELHPVRAE